MGMVSMAIGGLSEISILDKICIDSGEVGERGTCTDMTIGTT